MVVLKYIVKPDWQLLNYVFVIAPCKPLWGFLWKIQLSNGTASKLWDYLFLELIISSIINTTGVGMQFRIKTNTNSPHTYNLLLKDHWTGPHVRRQIQI